MKKDRIIESIDNIFSLYNQNLDPNERSLLASNFNSRNNLTEKGKLYELYIMSLVLKKLNTDYNFNISFVGDNIIFKKKGGKIYQKDPHFVLENKDIKLDLFVDIEIVSLVCAGANEENSDKSAYFETDIALVAHGIDEKRPSANKLILIVECKSENSSRKSSFNKSIIREALGMRRTLSTYHAGNFSRLDVYSGRNASQRKNIPANPAFEFFVYCADSQCEDYMSIPNFFGIEILWEEFF